MFSAAPFQFIWTDHTGQERVAGAHVTPQGIQFGTTGEELPDFFFFAANQTVSAVENATRFSDLSRARRDRQFIQVFTKEYQWIEDLNIEVVAGAPVVHATLREFSEKLPVTNVSGGINRMMSIMLALASRHHSVTVVDEIENGI